VAEESRFDFRRGGYFSALESVRTCSAAHTAFSLLDISSEAANHTALLPELTISGKKPPLLDIFIVLPF
jgi:hypothetical protein